jgi:3-oxoacyl-[acyl-carrier protein] reductase
VKLGLASRRGTDLGLPDALGLRCDVRDLDQVEAAVEETVHRFGGLDIVVANAGVGSYHPFGEEPIEHARFAPRSRTSSAPRRRT